MRNSTCAFFQWDRSSHHHHKGIWAQVVSLIQNTGPTATATLDLLLLLLPPFSWSRAPRALFGWIHRHGHGSPGLAWQVRGDSRHRAPLGQNLMVCHSTNMSKLGAAVFPRAGSSERGKIDFAFYWWPGGWDCSHPQVLHAAFGVFFVLWHWQSILVPQGAEIPTGDQGVCSAWRHRWNVFNGVTPSFIIFNERFTHLWRLPGSTADIR